MSEGNGGSYKLAALSTIAQWLLVLFLGCWFIFKPDNSLNKDVVERLTVAVDKMSIASENIVRTSIAQREWSETLQKSIALNNQKRDSDYGDLYEKYGYDSKNGGLSLNDLYSSGVRVTEGVSGGELRGDEDGASKAGPVQETNSVPKGQSH